MPPAPSASLPGAPGVVLVVGSITIDVTSFSQRLPRPGETIRGDDFSMVLGGKGANQALAASRAGAETVMVGCIGDDVFAQLAVDELTRHGIDISSVRAVDGPTGVAHIRVDASGENDIVAIPLANAHVTSADVDTAIAALAGRGSVLLTQLETPLDVMGHATRSARAHGMTVVLDPAPAGPIDPNTWTEVDIVTPNESEAATLTGVDVVDVDSARLAGEWFVRRGVQHAVITLAAHGVVVVDQAGSRHLPAPTVTVVDTTAAGDAFAGYLGAGLAAGLTLDEALPTAIAAGATTVTRRGASSSLPTAAEVEQLVADRH